MPQSSTYSSQRPPLLDELYTSNPHAAGAIVGAVEYPKLETALLRDMDDRFYYGANCSSCLHASRLNLRKLREHLGGDFPLAKVRARLKCDLCGSKAVTVTYLTPEQCTGSLVHLFDKKPKG